MQPTSECHSIHPCNRSTGYPVQKARKTKPDDGLVLKRKRAIPFTASITPLNRCSGRIVVLFPAAHDFVCRKKRILSISDRTCHQDSCSIEFLVTHSSLTVSTTSYRRPIQLFVSDFVEIRYTAITYCVPIYLSFV